MPEDPEDPPATVEPDASQAVTVGQRLVAVGFGLAALALATGLWPRWRAEAIYRKGQILSLHPGEDLPGRLEAYERAAATGWTDGIPELRAGELHLARAAASRGAEREQSVRRALDLTSQAVELRPLDGRARVARARVAGLAGLATSATEDLRAAVAIAPRHPGVLYAAHGTLVRTWAQRRDPRDLRVALTAASNLRAMGERISPAALVRALDRVPAGEVVLAEALEGWPDLTEFLLEWVGEQRPDWRTRLGRVLPESRR